MSKRAFQFAFRIGRIVARVFGPQHFTIRREDVDALPRVVTRTLTVALLRNFQKESPFRVLPAALIPIVPSHRDEILRGHLDNFRIGEGGHTAPHNVVSPTPERVPVHLPE